MSRGSNLIGIWLSFSILLLSAGLVAHVMIIPLILGSAGRDSWISILLAAPIFLLWLWMLLGIMKRIHGQRLPDWIEREFGIFTSWLFRIPSAFVLLVSGTYTLHDTSAWTADTYMQQTPLFVIVIVAAAVSMLAAYRGIRTIALTSGILLPIVLGLGYFVMGANTKYKDYSLLLPIMEKGWQPVIEGTFYTLAGLSELWIILLFQHHIRSRLRWWHLMLLGLFIVGMTMGPTLGGITEFGAEEAAKQRHTAFEQWKILKVGELLQHVDFLSIYQWLCGSFTRVTISLYLIVDLLNIRKPSKRAIALVIFAAIMAGVGIYPFRDDELLQYLKRIHFPALLFYVGTITILLSIAAPFRKNRKEHSAYESTKQ